MPSTKVLVGFIHSWLHILYTYKSNTHMYLYTITINLSIIYLGSYIDSILSPSIILEYHMQGWKQGADRETLEEYMRELQKLSRALFELIRETLNIDKREMEEMFEDGMQALRMTYYPPCPRPDKVMGLTPHSDASGITILLQVNGVSGFQVKKDGVWLPVDILPDALIINLGDVMEILSNGLYKSIEHRAVVNPEKERMSMAMFFNPKFEAEVGPSPSLLCRINQPPRFRRMIMEQYVKDFFSRRLNGKTFLHYMKI